MGWWTRLDWRWGGHLKGRGSIQWPAETSYFAAESTDTLRDGTFEFRLKNELFLGRRFKLETHYEFLLTGGDTRRRNFQLAEINPLLGAWARAQIQPPDDRRRFLDLIGVIHDGEGHILYHRLDRLALTWQPDWGFVRVGRQAVTWGNGMLFNPLDLLNPFAPTDVERDYKVGDDMVSVQIPAEWGDFQFLAVPRRDPETRATGWNQSSVAVKWHFNAGTTDLDLLLVRHYRDVVIGAGSVGYLGAAAWRLDATWTFLNSAARREGFLSLVANMDYSWVWWKKNLYGYLEFHYNGLGADDYSLAALDPALLTRVERGEMFTVGRFYLDGMIQAEVHPLVNLYATAIVNLADPSGIVQPRAVWNAGQNLQLTCGANLVLGDTGTEFGGIPIPFTDNTTRAPAGVYIWLTYFF
ncbi:MAG: hypothetical protein JXQ27_07970 [Acidobacteria bacterium]|nr:hypothetical protein [Acidobacteriota bacterium]